MVDRRSSRHRSLLRELDELDRALYEKVATWATPRLDRILRPLSNMANWSALWWAIAALLAVFGGRVGRRAAVRGMVSVGVVSATVNLGLKSLHQRPRPGRALGDPAQRRHVRMPTSSSFPSGHSASAFAFTSSVGVELPMLMVPLGLLAAGVAYSRVHTGVHYPSDVLAGSVVGAATGQLVARVTDHLAGD
jgi:undecaprenyl-diphosphatase